MVRLLADKGEKLACPWHVGTFIGMLARKNEKLARIRQVGTWTTLAHMACMARDLANYHTLCESVNMTTKTTINFHDTTTLRYLVIKEKFE